MAQEEKPFVCYRKGRWQMKLEPRNAAGWRALGWWMLVFVLATALHLGCVIAWKDRPVLPGVATMIYLAFVLGWAINMIRWMLARSEVITRDR